jgi:hypothetical protein
MKLEVKESSEKRSSRQLFPTPECSDSPPIGTDSVLVLADNRPFDGEYEQREVVLQRLLSYKDCRSRREREMYGGRLLTTVANQEKLYKVIVVLPASGHPFSLCPPSAPHQAMGAVRGLAPSSSTLFRLFSLGCDWQSVKSGLLSRKPLHVFKAKIRCQCCSSTVVCPQTIASFSG